MSSDELSVKQREVLALIASGDYSPTQACAKMGVTMRTFQRWQSLSPTFRDALDSLFTLEDIAQLKKTLGISAIGAIEVFEQAMQEANKKILVPVTCPHCETVSEVWCEVPDWKSRISAAQTLLKINGLLVDRREAKVDVNVNYRLTMAESLAFLQWQRGQFERVSPRMEARLRELGKIGDSRPQLPAGSNEIVDAAFSVITEDSNENSDH